MERDVVLELWTSRNTGSFTGRCLCFTLVHKQCLKISIIIYKHWYCWYKNNQMISYVRAGKEGLLDPHCTGPYSLTNTDLCWLLKCDITSKFPTPIPQGFVVVLHCVTVHTFHVSNIHTLLHLNRHPSVTALTVCAVDVHKLKVALLQYITASYADFYQRRWLSDSFLSPTFFLKWSEWNKIGFDLTCLNVGMHMRDSKEMMTHWHVRQCQQRKRTGNGFKNLQQAAAKKERSCV